MNQKQIILEQIKTTAESLAQRLNYPPELLPTHNDSAEGAQIEIDKYGDLYYVIVERGETTKRDYAVDVNDLLFKVFSSITFKMACEYELKVRRESEDFRRQMFAKQEELLGVLNEQWKLRGQEEHRQILQRYPFDDNANFRVNYTNQLRGAGMSSDEAWLEACKKYPLPKGN